MKPAKLSFALLLAALWHGPLLAADDWLQNLQKGDWQKAIEGAADEATQTPRSQRRAPPATPRATPQRNQNSTAASSRARAAREARAAQRAAEVRQDRAVTQRRSAVPVDTSRSAERRRSRQR